MIGAPSVPLVPVVPTVAVVPLALGVPLPVPVLAVLALPDAIGRVVLHGGPHAGQSSNAVPLEFVAASVAIVGLVGGLLYWFYGHRTGSA